MRSGNKKISSFGSKICLYSENRAELLNNVKHGSLGFKDQLNIITFSFGGSVEERPGGVKKWEGSAIDWHVKRM